MRKLSLVLMLLLLDGDVIASAHAHAGTTNAAALVAPVERALILLGRPGTPVILFDPSQYRGRHRATLERLEAFVSRKPVDGLALSAVDGLVLSGVEGPALSEVEGRIYLNRRSRTFEDALSGQPHGVYVLAAILLHEIAHLDGKDEAAALRAEQQCIYQFMKEGRIEVDVALAHLRNAWALRR